MILKIELIAYLYNLSERQVEVFVNENLPAKYFVGLAVGGKAPDHSTLTVFHERLVRNVKVKIFEELLETVVREAQVRGVIQVVGSVHTVANVNTAKDLKRQDKGGKGRRDPDDQWGAKHKRKVKNAQGKEEELAPPPGSAANMHLTHLHGRYGSCAPHNHLGRFPRLNEYPAYPMCLCPLGGMPGNEFQPVATAGLFWIASPFCHPI